MKRIIIEIDGNNVSINQSEQTTKVSDVRHKKHTAKRKVFYAVMTNYDEQTFLDGICDSFEEAKKIYRRVSEQNAAAYDHTADTVIFKQCIDGKIVRMSYNLPVELFDWSGFDE